MSESSATNNLAIRASTEFKAIRTLINGNAADLSALTTTQKASLVAALNGLQAEVTAAATSGGASINDAAPGGSTTYSSSKVVALDNAIRATITALTAADVGAASEAFATNAASNAAAAVKAEILGGASAAWDTLQELKVLLDGLDAENDGLLSAIGNRVRFDAAQTLTAPEKAQAIANIGAVSQAAFDARLGVETDYVATFNAGLV